jgi:TatD DNase family protein
LIAKKEAAMIPVLDAHIHLDLYAPEEQKQLLASLAEHRVAGVVSVSMHLESCKEQLRLKQLAPRLVFPAFGFHPEQPLPDREAEQKLFEWIREHCGNRRSRAAILHAPGEGSEGRTV